MNDEHTQDKTRIAARHLLTVFAVVSLCAASTYLIPQFERFQPWQKGDALPVTRLFKTWGSVPEFAGAGGSYRSSTSSKNLASEVGKAVAANIGENKKVPTPQSDSKDRVSVNRNEFKSIDTFIEGRQFLNPFFEALAATSKKQKGAITRIAHYGDSSIATDLITHTLRRLMQLRFGDSGHGFVLAARGYLPYRHRQVTHRANNRWLVKEIVRKHDRQGFYGYGGVQFLAKPGARAAYGTKDDTAVGKNVSRFDVYYQKHPNGGSLSLRVDKNETQMLDTRGEVEDVVHTVEVPDGEHRLELRNAGGGPSRIYGVVLERDKPGVVYDSLGLVGARGNRLLNFDAVHIKAQIERRGLSLLILAFGGNEASDNKSEASYYKDYVAIIDRMRGDNEDLPCMLMSPLDQAQRRRGKIRTLRTIPLIIAAQRRAAEDRGCAYFNTFEAMGGMNSMSRWYNAKPRLAMGDFRHATPLGYEVIANLFYKALLAAYAEFLNEHPDIALIDPPLVADPQNLP